MKIEIEQPYGFSYIGQKPNNEDNIYPKADKASNLNSLFLVCDGVGGREKGEVASSELCKSFAHSVSGDFAGQFSRAEFQIALNEAYNQLNQLDDPQNGSKMASTLTFLKFHNGGAMVAHIGDSRVYHIRPSAENPILFRTEDHSLVASLVKAGMITEEEAANHPKRNVILRAVQPHQDDPAEADIYETKDLQQGDYFFLCSDGVLENLTDTLLVTILRKEISDKKKIAEIEHICKGRTKDNYSAWLLQIKNVSKAETIEQKKNILVLDEATLNPLPGNTKTKGRNFLKLNKWSWLLLISLLVIMVIILISYPKRNPAQIEKRTDSTEIKSNNTEKKKTIPANPKENSNDTTVIPKEKSTDSITNLIPKDIKQTSKDSTKSNDKITEPKTDSKTE